MGFPITVGNKVFTSQDFEGRNYVSGYPQLLQEFAGRASSSPVYLGFEIEQRIVPSYGSIVVKLPHDVDVFTGQVLDLEAPDGSYMGVFIDSTSPDGTVKGRVCFLSETLVKPHSKWKVGLAQVAEQTPSVYPGYLEKRFDNFSLSANRKFGSGYEYYNAGNFADGSIEANFPYVRRNVLGWLNTALTGVIFTSHVGVSISCILKPNQLNLDYQYIIDAFIQDESDMTLTFHGDLILYKTGSTININSLPDPGTYPPSVLRRYRYTYTSATSNAILQVDGTTVFNKTVIDPPEDFTFAGKIKLKKLHRRFYYV